MMSKLNKMSKFTYRLTKVVSLCGLCSMLASNPVVGFSQDRPSDPAAVASSEAKTTLDEKQAAQEKAQTAEGDGARGVMRKPSVGRLPPYFASIVDSRQREAIYTIRAAMATRIFELEKQLEELRQAEMREIEEVLTDDQRQQLVALRAARSVTRTPSTPSRE